MLRPAATDLEQATGTERLGSASKAAPSEPTNALSLPGKLDHVTGAVYW